MLDDAPESAFERESSRLNEGLKSCRSVMNNYRAMMLGDQASEHSDSDNESSYVSTTDTTGESFTTSGAN